MSHQSALDMVPFLFAATPVDPRLFHSIARERRYLIPASLRFPHPDPCLLCANAMRSRPGVSVRRVRLGELPLTNRYLPTIDPCETRRVSTPDVTSTIRRTGSSLSRSHDRVNF